MPMSCNGCSSCTRPQAVGATHRRISDWQTSTQMNHGWLPAMQRAVPRTSLAFYSCAVWQAYYFPMWDLNGNWNGETRYERWSINMFLFKGSEMGNITEHDDEAQISMVSCAHGNGLLRRQMRSGIRQNVRIQFDEECTHVGWLHEPVKLWVCHHRLCCIAQEGCAGAAGQPHKPPATLQPRT